MSCVAVIDVWSRQIVGWSIADHIRTELVVDAVGDSPSIDQAADHRREAGTRWIMRVMHHKCFLAWGRGR